MTVLCFGDSNTYGYDPRSFLGERYPADVRWTGLLSRETGWRVLEAGQNGREIPHTPAALDALGRLPERCGPPDAAVVMLGGNDLLQGLDAAGAADRMERCLRRLQDALPPEAILLTAPPAMVRGAWVAEDRLVEESARLAEQYEALARRLGVRFADAGKWGVELLFDGVHFSEAGHRTFAHNIRICLEAMVCS